MSRIRRYGRDAALVEVDHPAALYRALSRSRIDGVVDLVPGARTLLVRWSPGAAPDLDWIEDWQAEPSDERQGHLVEITVTYDGPDLGDVTGHTGLSTADIVEIHTGAELTVAFCGFAPGFAYLTGLPDRLHVPRRSAPRESVPAGSVGLAGEFTGVYPRSSPGGWQLIGRTDASLWDPSADPPALLSPGDRVRFTAVNR